MAISATTATTQLPPHRQMTDLGPIFYQVKNGSDKMDELTRIFNEILTPLYGSQEKALQQIAAAQDRTCFLLYGGENNNFPVGVIVFKTVLSDEFKEYNIRNSIEIKSLFVVDSGNNSGRGLGSILLNKIQEEANKLRLNHASLHVTVSETKNESLNFFKKKGFQIIHSWQDRYIRGVTEYLLSLPVGVQQALARSSPDRSKIQEQKSGQIWQKKSPASDRRPEEKDSRDPKRIRTVRDAHWDDIHGLLRVGEGFVSGSKDNSLCMWDQKGDLIKIVRDIEPREVTIDERDWVTAMGTVNDEYWASGERNGRICLWDKTGRYVRDITPKRPKTAHVSHEYNQRRIMCLAGGKNPHKPSVFVGFPTLFDEFNLIENRTTSSTEVHKNDWVYCIHPLTETKILAVTAGNLNMWSKQNSHWQLTKTLVKEPPRTGKTRQHISSLSQVKDSPHLFGLGVFGGFVRVVDVEQGKIVNEWREHRGRVWAVENTTKGVFASGAEDGLIKLWDMRSNRSVHTFKDQPGEVTALLSLDDNTLVAGSCAKHAVQSNEGAELLFYDIRL